MKQIFFVFFLLISTVVRGEDHDLLGRHVPREGEALQPPRGRHPLAIAPWEAGEAGRQADFQIRVGNTGCACRDVLCWRRANETAELGALGCASNILSSASGPGSGLLNVSGLVVDIINVIKDEDFKRYITAVALLPNQAQAATNPRVFFQPSLNSIQRNCLAALGSAASSISSTAAYFQSQSQNNQSLSQLIVPLISLSSSTLLFVNGVTNCALAATDDKITQQMATLRSTFTRLAGVLGPTAAIADCGIRLTGSLSTIFQNMACIRQAWDVSREEQQRESRTAEWNPARTATCALCYTTCDRVAPPNRLQYCLTRCRDSRPGGLATLAHSEQPAHVRSAVRGVELEVERGATCQQVCSNCRP